MTDFFIEYDNKMFKTIILLCNVLFLIKNTNTIRATKLMFYNRRDFMYVYKHICYHLKNCFDYLCNLVHQLV